MAGPSFLLYSQDVVLFTEHGSVEVRPPRLWVWRRRRTDAQCTIAGLLAHPEAGQGWRRGSNTRREDATPRPHGEGSGRWKKAGVVPRLPGLGTPLISAPPVPKLSRELPDAREETRNRRPLSSDLTNTLL